MRLRVRPMKPEDVRTCAALVVESPTERLRYGQELSQLSSAWMKLIRSASLNSSVVEDLDARTREPLGLGVSVFVADEFLWKLKALPREWIGPALTRGVLSNLSPVLGPEQVREANSNTGLNLAIWSGEVSSSQSDQSVDIELFKAFFDVHSGYRLKEVIAQPLDLQQVFACFQFGFSWLSDEGVYVDGRFLSDARLLGRPFFIGGDRESARRAFGSWLSTLFAYTPPQIYMRPGEQRLLVAALRGLTDEELAGELRISLSAVKKMWRAIYLRTGSILNGALPDAAHEDGNGKRGKEKKQHLLSYMRAHREELRAVVPQPERPGM